MSKTARDWTGYENANWLVHRRGDYSEGARKWLWVIECKACGNTRQRRTECLSRSVSCGCKNPEPANKGKGKATMQDVVTSYRLLRTSWV